MRIPEKPPSMFEMMENKSQGLLEAFSNKKVEIFLKNMIAKYYYWDKFKTFPMPDGIKPEIAWVCKEIMSMPQKKQISLADKKNTSFSYWMPDKVMQCLHFIDRNAAGKIETIDTIPSQQYRDRFIVSSLMDEAIASSQIEGASTTRKKAKEMLRKEHKPKNKSEQMIVNNYKAIKYIRKIKDLSITQDIILKLHSILTENTVDADEIGRFRKSPKDDDVRVFDFDGTVLHIPPNGKELTWRVNKFIDFANEDNEKEFTHPVVKAIILHFWIGYDHPFTDGNGRTARAIFYWYMLKKGYWLFEFISISRLVAKSYGGYKRAFLYSELADNDITYFLIYNLRLLKISINEIQKKIYHKQEQIHHASVILRRFPNINNRQKELLINAFKNPDTIYTIKEHSQFQQVTYQTARTDLLDLSNLGLLEKNIGGKELVFMASKKLEEVLDNNGTNSR